VETSQNGHLYIMRRNGAAQEFKDNIMLISEAKKHVGQIIDLEYNDRTGSPILETVEVFDVNFIALYGPCLITDIGDIRLDRIVRATPNVNEAAA
jgi:hypothetical protein